MGKLSRSSYKEWSDSNINFNDDKEEEDQQEEQAPYPKRLHYGVIAQELQELAPELVSINDLTDDHYLSVNYTELIPHLINKT